jgi:hypothetical protein
VNGREEGNVHGGEMTHSQGRRAPAIGSRVSLGTGRRPGNRLLVAVCRLEEAIELLLFERFEKSQ